MNGISRYLQTLLAIFAIAGCGGQQSLDEQVANGPVNWTASQRVSECALQDDGEATCLVRNLDTGQSALIYFRQDVCFGCDGGKGWYLADESIDQLP